MMFDICVLFHSFSSSFFVCFCQTWCHVFIWMNNHRAYTHRAFQSGFEIQPVMCQTINTFYDKNYCPWVSCGEWCLTKTSGFCPQIHATTRRNGTDIQLENCTRITTTSCPEVISILSSLPQRFFTKWHAWKCPKNAGFMLYSRREYYSLILKQCFQLSGATRHIQIEIQL